MVDQYFLAEGLKEGGHDRVEGYGHVVVGLGHDLLLVDQLDVALAVVRHFKKFWLDEQEIFDLSGLRRGTTIRLFFAEADHVVA